MSYSSLTLCYSPSESPEIDLTREVEALPKHLEMEMTGTRITELARTAARCGVEVGRRRVEVGLVDTRCSGVEVGFSGIEVGFQPGAHSLATG